MNAIGELIGGGQSISYYPRLARALGKSPAAALLVQQIGYHAAHAGDVYGWVEVDQATLEWELVLSPKVQATTRRHLEDLGVLSERRQKKGGNLEYRIDWDKVEALVKNPPTGKSKPASRLSQRDTPNGKSPIEEEKKSKGDSLRSSPVPGESDDSSDTVEGGEIETKLLRGDSTEAMKPGQYFVQFIYDRIYEARASGLNVADEDPTHLKTCGRIAAAAFTRGNNPLPIESIEAALRYMVLRAADQVKGSPKGWVAFHTAHDAIKDSLPKYNESTKRSLTGVTQAQREADRKRRTQGYEDLFEDKGEEFGDLDARLKELRNQREETEEDGN